MAGVPLAIGPSCVRRRCAAKPETTTAGMNACSALERAARLQGSSSGATVREALEDLGQRCGVLGRDEDR